MSDMLEEQEGTLNQLPEDVLANILGRLAPRFLATSRCVCKPWCTIIDARRLLRTDLLPFSLADQIKPCNRGIRVATVAMHTSCFSSRTKKWEQRSFIREGEAAGTVADMRLDRSYSNHYHNSVYWRGVLYVHCQTNFVMRISLLDGKYQVIKPPPVDTELIPDPKLYLGKSQKGVYCALDDHYIYILDESYGKMEWVSKTSVSLRHRQTDRPKPWTLQDINYGGSHDEYQDGNDEVIMEEKFKFGCDNNNVVETKEWDSDDDNVIDTEGWGNRYFGGHITFLGFHPYKEVVFLSEGLSRGLAYHLNTSKVQELGNLSPTHYGTCMGIQPFIEGSFPYTPWTGEFPEEN